jgi:hypothetical protein
MRLAVREIQAKTAAQRTFCAAVFIVRAAVLQSKHLC